MPFEEDLAFAKELETHLGEIVIVDIGCGPDKFPGAIGVDIVERPGIVDIPHDLDIVPWPLQENCFDIVLCNHLIEHVGDFVAMIREIHRILKPGGYLIARTPHYSHVDSYVDPTHRRHLTTTSFDFFVEGSKKAGLYSDVLFAKDEVKLSFGSGLFSQFGRLLSALSMRQYEKYWCRLFPATTLYFRLKGLP